MQNHWRNGKDSHPEKEKRGEGFWMLEGKESQVSGRTQERVKCASDGPIRPCNG